MGIQSVDLWVMAPTIVLALGALLALLVDLFVAGKGKGIPIGCRRDGGCRGRRGDRLASAVGR